MSEKLQDAFNKYATVIQEVCPLETWEQIVRTITSKALEGDIRAAGWLKAALIIPAARITAKDRVESLRKKEEEEEEDWSEWIK